MKHPNKTSSLKRCSIAVAVALGVGCLSTANAANHREAPLTAIDTKADIADFFAFVSYDNPSKVTFIMTVDPFLEPSNGPNYFPFDPNIEYRINIDNDFDAKPDVSFAFNFRTQIRAPGVFTGFVGAGTGLVAPANSPAPVAPGSPVVPPAVTALNGPGSEGLNLRQTYQVRMERYRSRGRRDAGNKGAGTISRSTRLGNRKKLIAVPSNVGPRTMPDYAALADQGIYQLERNIKVFAGTVEDPFWIDLGGAFDSLNFRTDAFDTGVPGVLSDAQEANDNVNFAADDVSGFNINAIAIEVPIALISLDRKRHDASDPLAVIGAWSTTSRSKFTKLRSPGKGQRGFGPKVQIQRMANPLFNELIIGTGFKDQFSQSPPHRDKVFANFALDPLLARVLNALYETTVGPDILPIPAPPRTDLLPLVQYGPPIAPAGTTPGPIADLLRLNTGIPPTPKASRSRLGFITLLDDDPHNDDPAGWPNGRRVSDDVTDVATRAVAGIFAGPEFNRFPHNRIGDGVNANDAPYRETFPYVGFAHSGRNSRHIDPGEPGCTGICPEN